MNEKAVTVIAFSLISAVNVDVFAPIRNIGEFSRASEELRYVFTFSPYEGSNLPVLLVFSDQDLSEETTEDREQLIIAAQALITAVYDDGGALPVFDIEIETV